MVPSACRQPASKGLSETGSKLPLVIPVTASGWHDPTKQPATHLCRIEWPPLDILASPLAYRDLAQLCQLHLQNALIPFPLTPESMGCTVTEPHSKGQMFSSLDLIFYMSPQFQE